MNDHINDPVAVSKEDQSTGAVLRILYRPHAMAFYGDHADALWNASVNVTKADSEVVSYQPLEDDLNSPPPLDDWASDSAIVYPENTTVPNGPDMKLLVRVFCIACVSFHT